jgi:hypothetical protein
VNRPSVEALGLTTVRKIMPHAISQERKARKEVWKGGRRDKDRKREKSEELCKNTESDW